MIKEITKYVTEDGKEHRTIESAKEWIKRLEEADKANKMLKAGFTIGNIWTNIFARECPNSLLEVTKETGFAIRYWQCSDEPRYKICCIKPGQFLFVYGSAGKWAGPYGNDITITELARHYESQLKRKT